MGTPQDDATEPPAPRSIALDANGHSREHWALVYGRTVVSFHVPVLQRLVEQRTHEVPLPG